MSKMLIIGITTIMCGFLVANPVMPPSWNWALSAGGQGNDAGLDICGNPFGELFITGYISETATFEPSSYGGDGFTLTSAGLEDVFVAGVNSYYNWGGWQWGIRAGGPGNDRGVAICSSIGIFITGFFENTANFGLTTVTSCGDRDIFVSAVNGDWLWTSSAGGSGRDEGSGIAVDNAGNVYVTGYFSGSASFGATTLTSNGDKDIYLVKLDSNGNWLWAIQVGAAGEDRATDLMIDDSGNLYITGCFSGSVAFGSTVYTSIGNSDIFVSKLDLNGNWIWTATAGGTGNDVAHALQPDVMGNVYIGGSFQNTAYFGGISKTSQGMNDACVAKLDANGNWLWVYSRGGSENDATFGISADPDGYVYGTININIPEILSETGNANNVSMVLTSEGSGGTGLLECPIWSSAGDVLGNSIYQSYSNMYYGWKQYILAGGFFGSLFLENWFFGGSILLESSGQEDIFIGQVEMFDPYSPVELTSFSAISTSLNGVQLNWTTQSETNMLGYRIYRNLTNSQSTSMLITPALIPAINSSTQNTYSYHDIETVEYNTYYYWLESVEMQSSEFYGPVTVTVNSHEDDGMPEITTLQKVYPNPFNAGTSTNIDLCLKSGGNGTLTIYSLRGQIVRNYSIECGQHTIRWDGTDSYGQTCANGIYFIRFSTPSLYQTRKVMILN